MYIYKNNWKTQHFSSQKLHLYKNMGESVHNEYILYKSGATVLIRRIQNRMFEPFSKIWCVCANPANSKSFFLHFL